MSPLYLDAAECGRTWHTSHLNAAHRCILTPGHTQACCCFCGVSTDTPAASLPPGAPGQGAPSG